MQFIILRNFLYSEKSLIIKYLLVSLLMQCIHYPLPVLTCLFKGTGAKVTKCSPRLLIFTHLLSGFLCAIFSSITIMCDVHLLLLFATQHVAMAVLGSSVFPALLSSTTFFLFIHLRIFPFNLLLLNYL